MYKGILINDTSGSGHFGCITVVENIKTAALKYNLEICYTIKTNELWETDEKIKIIKGLDFVLVNGEGTMHSSKKKAFELSRVAVFCKKNNIPCFLINSVYENNSSQLSKNINCFDRIYVRESLSNKELSQVGIKSDIVPDMVFYKNIFINKDINKDIHCLYTGSVFRDVELNNYFLYKKMENKSSFTTIYKTSSKINSFSFVKKELLYLLLRIYADTRLNILKRIMMKFFNLRDTNEFRSNSIEALILKLNRSEKVITGYFHLTCFSILSNTPFVAISSNTHKIFGLLKDIGIESRLLDTKSFNSEIFVNKFTEHELIKIDIYLKNAEEKINLMFNEIFLFLKNKKEE